MDVFSDDPAKVAAWLQALANAILVMLVALNIVSLTDIQIAAIMGVVNIVAGAVGALWVRRHTTSLADPKTREGTKLVPDVSNKPITRGID